MDTVLNRKFGSVKRKIAFIIDNCAYHSEVENLEWTELIFPSPKHQVTYSTDRPRCNSCCKTQTSFTSRLQTNFSFGLKRTNANHIHSVSVMMMLAKAWNAFSNKTFTNCFKQTHIYEKEVERVLNEDDLFGTLDDIEEDSVQTLEADLVFLMKERFGDQVDPNITLD